MHPPLKAVLFDLDGTLCDTVPDLQYALNTVLRRYEKPEASEAEVFAVASQGAKGLIELGCEKGLNRTHMLDLREELIEDYHQMSHIQGRLYDGVAEVLAWIEAKRLPWGIVTNKMERLTHPTLKSLGLSTRAACVVCGDTLPVCKPDPAPVRHACTRLNIAPEATCFVGDTERDIIAGNAAGSRTVAALWGHIPDMRAAKYWRSEIQLHQPLGLIDWLDNAVS